MSASEVEGPRWPFDPETVKLHRGTPSPPSTGPSLPYRLRRQLHTLAFLSPAQAFLLAIALLLCLHSAALVLFTRGFLLTRQALTDINDCTPINPATGQLDPACSLPATHSKLVLVIVDALRADFVLPVAQNSPKLKPYHNHIQLPAKLTTSHPTHSFLAHFIADAPTTTLQRLKGLTTGSLPTFVDAGSNFGGEAVTEDNWLAQAKRAGKRIAFTGDDTWMAVFPPSPADSTEEGVWAPNSTWPYDSFNVEDLDTVDRGVVSHLLPLLDANLASPTGSWDILIAHALGLDHAGHRFGAVHPETNRKLDETERLLQDVVDRLDDDTLLVVLGDHGMTERGDHGGDSREELEAALWIYSKGAPLTDPSWFERPTTSADHPLASLFNASALANELGDQLHLAWPEKGVRTARSVAQVDLVPTISLLLGLPIPFASLGLPIPDLFFHPSTLPTAPASSTPPPKSKKRTSSDVLSPLETVLHAHLLQASQLSYYLKTYTSSPSGQTLTPFLPELHFTLSLAQSAYRGAHASGADPSGMQLRALLKFWEYARKARSKARDVWATFDLVLIGAGLGVWIASLFVAARLWAATKNGNRARFVVGQALEGAILAGWMTTALWLLSAFERFGGVRPLFVLFILSSGASIGALSTPSSPSSPSGTLGFGPRWTPKDLLPLTPLLAHCALFASNSYTVFEDRAVLFLLNTVLILGLLKALSAPEARLRTRLVGFSIAALVGVRLIAVSTICREEQASSCVSTFNLIPGSYAALGAIGVAFVAAWTVPSLLRASLRLSKSDEGVAPYYLSGGVRFLLVLAVGYWAVDWTIAGLDLGDQGKTIATGLKTALARVVMVGVVGGSSLVWWYTPVPLTVRRETVRDKDGNALRTQVTFTGFANALGSTYLLFFSTALALFVLVSPPTAQVVLALYVGVLGALLECFDSQRDVEHLRSAITAKTIADLLSTEISQAPSHEGPDFLQISTVALLSHLVFFSTGHQAALSSIQWSTAFIGFPTLTYPLSPLLVILNTLSPYLLTSLSIPLLVFWNLSPTMKDQPPLALLRNLLRAAVAYSSYQATVALSSAIFAAHFRRHLMVWKIFAPRFMIGAITVLGTDTVLIGAAMAWGALGTIGKAKATFGTKVVE
ncbi:hypothetical protein RQP46_009555 [Phenoliferia psychrophenolica]